MLLWSGMVYRYDMVWGSTWYGVVQQTMVQRLLDNGLLMVY